MAHQTQTETQKGSRQDQTSNPLENVEQGFNSGYDARSDKTRGDQTKDEAQELTDALNPVHSKPTGRDKVDQSNADPNDAQKRQAERGGY